MPGIYNGVPNTGFLLPGGPIRSNSRANVTAVTDCERLFISSSHSNNNLTKKEMQRAHIGTPSEALALGLKPSGQYCRRCANSGPRHTIAVL